MAEEIGQGIKALVGVEGRELGRVQGWKHHWAPATGLAHVEMCSECKIYIRF